MKIAIITSGILPIPAIQGGAVENLIDSYLEYNDLHQLHDITIYSVFHPQLKNSPAKQSKVNHYKYVDIHSFLSRLRARIYGYFHRNECYSYKLEFFFEQVYKKLRKERFDLIILENRPGFALKLHHRISTPIMTHLHTNMLHQPSDIVRNIIKANNKLIVVSEFIKKQVESTGEIVPITVIHNGLDLKKFNIRTVNPISRHEIGMKENHFIAVYSGRLVPDKGLKELILAILQLQDTNPEITLLVVGGDNYADSIQKTPFIEEIHKLGKQANGRVYFTGFVPYSQIPAYLAVSNVAVVPSRINDAFPTTCIEATAMGLPVIATNDGGIPETLAGQKCIITDRNGNITYDFAHALIEIKNNYSRYLGNKLNTEFTKEAFAKRFLESLRIENGR